MPVIRASCLICTETETVQSSLRFNYVEFGTIKFRIHQLLPYSMVHKKQPANFDSGGYSETWLRALIAEA